jgi:hypothetical protein
MPEYPETSTDDFEEEAIGEAVRVELEVFRFAGALVEDVERLQLIDRRGTRSVFASMSS